jgi:hypothetical protein
MPLFMDRHDVPGVTAEQVAQAHLADLDMGARFGVQFLAYWFDADQGEAFCLAKAPTGDSLTAVHKATHGLIPNEIISVSEDNVLRLLGRMSETGGDTQAVNPFRTIMFTVGGPPDTATASGRLLDQQPGGAPLSLIFVVAGLAAFVMARSRFGGRRSPS